MLAIEITQKQSQIYISSFYLAGKGAISVMIPAIYFMFGGKNWHIPYGLTLISAPILCILTFFIPESPRYLYERKMYPELRVLIKKFADSNGVRMSQEYDIDKEIEVENLKNKKQVREIEEIAPETESKMDYLRDKLIF